MTAKDKVVERKKVEQTVPCEAVCERQKRFICYTKRRTRMMMGMT
jgi:hypothetical protein